MVESIGAYILKLGLLEDACGRRVLQALKSRLNTAAIMRHPVFYRCRVVSMSCVVSSLNDHHLNGSKRDTE